MSSAPIRTLQTVSFLNRQSSYCAEMTHTIIPVHILLENLFKELSSDRGYHSVFLIQNCATLFLNKYRSEFNHQTAGCRSLKIQYIEDGISFACFLKNYYTLYRENKNKKDVLIFAILRDANEK